MDVEELLREVTPAAPCGENLEYDLEFLAVTNDALQLTARADAAAWQGADWFDLAARLRTLFTRTKDLRLAVLMTRVQIELQGWDGLDHGLTLVRLLLERHWHDVHPQLDPDDGLDPTQRVNVLAGLADEALVRALDHAAMPTATVIAGISGELFAIEAVLANRVSLDTGSTRLHLVAAITRALKRLDRSEAGVRVDEPGWQGWTKLDLTLRPHFKLTDLDLDGLDPPRLELRHQLKNLLVHGVDQPGIESSPTVGSAGVRRLAENPEARVADEDIQFTFYRPATVAVDEWRDLLAFAHPADRFDAVHDRARRRMAEPPTELRTVTIDVSRALPPGSRVTLEPWLPGVEFEPRRHSFVLTESIHEAAFRFRAAKSLAGRLARGRVAVYLGAILVAEAALTVRVRDTAESPAAGRPILAHPYRKIFASYAHEDRAIVEQFENLARALGDEYLRDVTSLRAGEEWNERLGELIADAHVFQLFWSRRSMVSPFVRHEWERALELRRPYFIRPVYWEDPLPARPSDGLPPPELSRLHFTRVEVAAE